MEKTIVRSSGAPIPIAPYSQAVKVDKTIYVSGFIALDPQTGKVVPGGIREQTIRVMESVKAVLETAGSSMTDVVKTNVYLTDMGNYAAMNEIFGKYFPDNPPARVTIGVQLPLPELLIEIDAIACTR